MTVRCKVTAIMALLLLVPLGGCATGQERSVAVRKGGQETIAMTASNYKFDPAVIKASPGEVLTVKIENVSGTDHNFTIKDPSGKVLQDVDLPEKSTIEIRIDLKEPGVYPFYCDKPLHPTMGMEGRVEVE